MRWFLSLLLAVVLLSGCIEKVEKKPNGFDQAKAIAACNQIIDKFQATLKTHLMAALADSGNPAGAVYVCSDIAPSVADSFSAMPGISIRRVSLRQRNRHFAPDSFEVAALTRFYNQPSGEVGTYFKAIKEKGTIKEFRYMKEIKTGQLCLKCHGNPELFSPSLIKVLDDLYPGDQAVNYLPGESRGAFSIILTYPEAKETITSLLSENEK